MNTLAIDIGGTKFSVALFEGEQMTLRRTLPTDREGGPGWMVEQIAMMVTHWTDPEGPHRVRFDRCGVGFGGPVDFAKQRVVFSTHVEGWLDFDLVASLRQLLRVPVMMDNDANTGALGEAHYGAGIGCDPLFYMTLSTGIGGGIVTEGKVYRGADSYAGEVGHLTIRPDGPECLCGAHGCFERMCGGLWVERDYGRAAEDMFQDAKFVSRYVADLALGIKAAIMLLNPARIVIGGGISRAEEVLFGPLRAQLGRVITSWSRARVDVMPAALGDDSVLYGALVLAKELL